MAKYRIAYAAKFNKEYKKLNDADKDLVDEVIQRLANGEVLEEKYNDHLLKGKLKGLRDCHIKPDLVLVYEIDKGVLILTNHRIGKHAKVFG